MNLYIISGVTGMTGNELARLLISKGESVIGFDNFFASSINTVSDIIDNERFAFFEYDLRSDEQMNALKAFVTDKKSSYEKLFYVNCAAVVSTEYFYHVHDTFETNVVGMNKFLNQAIEVGADVFINCSTSEVYSMNSYREGGVREDDYLTLANAEHSQRTSYATGKLMTEFFTKDAVDNKKIAACSIRFANVYSKNELYPKHIIPHILTQLKTQGKVTLLENAKKTYRTFLHNQDSCLAVYMLMHTPSALDGTVYNVGTQEEISIIDLVYLCADLLKIDKPEIEFKGVRTADPQRRLLSTQKLRQRTGWTDKVTLTEGIKMCVEEMNK